MRTIGPMFAANDTTQKVPRVPATTSSERTVRATRESYRRAADTRAVVADSIYWDEV